MTVALDAAFTRGPATALDGETAAIVDNVRGWFRSAAAKQRGLVSCYH